MKVIIIFTFCCNNLWKSKFMALEKPGKLSEFFLLLCGHPVIVRSLKFQSRGRGFCCHLTTVGKLFTHIMPLVSSECNLVPVKRRGCSVAR